MRVLDMFSGTGSATQPMVDAGWQRVTIDQYQRADIKTDILNLTYRDLMLYGPFDLIWASPPCTSFSVASMWKHWNADKEPQTEEAVHNQLFVNHTVQLMLALKPQWWIIENPVGMLRHLPPVQGLPRKTITYCQFGADHMKPTDLWTNIDIAERKCRNGEQCHVASPRGTHNVDSVQGPGNNKTRSVVPYGLGTHILEVIDGE